MPSTRGLNFFEADPNLLHALRTYAAARDVERALPHLRELGRVAGSELDELAAQADRNPPVLRNFDEHGNRVDEIEYHPSFVAMQKIGFTDFGFAAMSHREGVLGWPTRVPHVVKYALSREDRIALRERGGDPEDQFALDAQISLLATARGELVTGVHVREVDPSGSDVVVRGADGRTFDADVVVLDPGPGAEPLLRPLGVDIPFTPMLEQVCHVGRDSATDDLPCIYEGPIGDEPGMYGMPTPARGYKLGIDRQLRTYRDDDHDRVPDPGITAAISARAARAFESIDPTVVDAQVCTWTDSPDGRFVIDTIHDGRIVVAAGDSGEGFKYSALMGPVLADLAEGAAPDDDVAALGLARFAGGASRTRPSLGH